MFRLGHPLVPAEVCTSVCTRITPVLLLSDVLASIGSSYAGLCNGQHCVHLCLSRFCILSPLSASLGFVTNVSDFGLCVIGFSMNFEISYQLFHCALAFFACCWRLLSSPAVGVALLPAVGTALFGFSMSSMSFSLSFVPVLFSSSPFSSESLCGRLRFRGAVLASSNITTLLLRDGWFAAGAFVPRDGRIQQCVCLL